ncbi:MAG: hypothetical protein IPK12_16470 [Gemmatimonadetes bacterium]|nr:hypothetical protein [Gemmatimonadota bacterium]
MAGLDQLLELLIHLVDLGLPGAAERGKRLASLARRIAERFEVPVELVHDLELAAWPGPLPAPGVAAGERRHHQREHTRSSAGTSADPHRGLGSGSSASGRGRVGAAAGATPLVSRGPQETPE